MNKSIFIDLDGTLLTDDNLITKTNQEMIKRAKEIGYKIYIITGKSFNGALPFYKQLDLNTTLVTLGGQEHYEPINKGFKKITKEMNRKLINKIIKNAEKNENINNFMLAESSGIFYAKKMKDSNLISLFSNSDDIKMFQDNIANDILNAYIEIEKKYEKKYLKYISDMKQKYGGFDFFVWNTKGNLPIIYLKPDQASKEQSMKEIIKKDHIKYTMAFGNGVSDIGMLREANVGIAMINSSDEVKESANFITKSDNNNSGVGKWINKHIFDI